jgi:hypothetical protein
LGFGIKARVLSFHKRSVHSSSIGAEPGTSRWLVVVSRFWARNVMNPHAAKMKTAQAMPTA